MRCGSEYSKGALKDTENGPYSHLRLTKLENSSFTKQMIFLKIPIVVKEE